MTKNYRTCEQFGINNKKEEKEIRDKIALMIRADGSVDMKKIVRIITSE